MWKKLLLSAAMLAAMCGPAAAAPPVLTISGSVPVTCEVNIYSGTTYALPAMNAAGVTNQNLGNLSFSCNAPNGFTRTIHSANAGRLVAGSSQGPVYTVAFQNASHASLNATHRDLTVDRSDVIVANSAFLGAGASADFFLTVPNPGPQGYYAGNYSDTITVTVTPAGP